MDDVAVILMPVDNLGTSILVVVRGLFSLVLWPIDGYPWESMGQDVVDALTGAILGPRA